MFRHISLLVVSIHIGGQSTLKDINDNVKCLWSFDSSRDASGLFFGTTAFQFIIALIIVSGSLEVTQPFTKQLQASDIDVLYSAEKIKLLSRTLNRMCQELNKHYDNRYSEAVQLAESVGVEPKKKRVAMESNRVNVPS